MRQREHQSVHFSWRFVTKCRKWRIMCLLKMGRKFSSTLLVSNSKREAGPVIVSAGSFSSPRPSELSHPDVWLPTVTCLWALAPAPGSVWRGLAPSPWQDPAGWGSAMNLPWGAGWDAPAMPRIVSGAGGMSQECCLSGGFQEWNRALCLGFFSFRLDFTMSL